MIRIAASFVFIFSILCKAEGEAHSTNGSLQLALTPPRGWNSYNSFSWIVTEAEFLDNAKFVSQHLLKFGYEYVVVDFLWYRKLAPGASVGSPGFDRIDEWGRPVPDPDRWPSSRDGSGLARVAQQVHAMGLKFGIHVMRGISTAAVQANTPILGAQGSPDAESGRPWRAADIAISGTECKWMKACFMGINASSEGGRAFVKSLYDQYASWGVDYIKHDCIFGEPDLRISEIELVSKTIAETGRPMVYSLSPGVHATPDMGKSVSNMVNMYRVTADDWDTWSDLVSHFDVARNFAAAGLLGASNGRGRSWPDLDMLPLGWLTDPGIELFSLYRMLVFLFFYFRAYLLHFWTFTGALVGPHRWSSLTRAEQRTQVSLWAMAKSPLMYGGDLRAMDNSTLSLITNPYILDINAHSINNHELVSTSPSNASSKSSMRFEASDCSEGKHTQGRWSLRPRRHPQNGDQVCWTNIERAWRKGGNLPLKCLNWTSQESNASTTSGFISSHGCLAPDVLGASNSYKQQSRTHNADCSRDEPSQLWQLTAEGRLQNEHTGLCAKVVESVGERIWLASLPSENKYFVAFFNLGSKETTIAVGIHTVIHTFRPTTKTKEVMHWMTTSRPKRRDILADSTDDLICKAFDVWNGHDLGVVENSLEALVEGHGATIFALTCTGIP